MIEVIVFVALCGVVLVGVTLASYPLVKLALKYAQQESPSTAVVDAVEQDVKAQQFQVQLKERYVEQPPPESKFRTVGKFTEVMWNGQNYRAPTGCERWATDWAAYPSGMTADILIAVSIAQAWKAEQLRKEWAS